LVILRLGIIEAGGVVAVAVLLHGAVAQHAADLGVGSHGRRLVQVDARNQPDAARVAFPNQVGQEVAFVVGDQFPVRTVLGQAAVPGDAVVAPQKRVASRWRRARQVSAIPAGRLGRAH